MSHITLHYITMPHYITLHYHTTLICYTLHDIMSHIALHYYATLHYIALHYITLHYITMPHYITLHCITLPCHITLHYYATLICYTLLQPLIDTVTNNLQQCHFCVLENLFQAFPTPSLGSRLDLKMLGYDILR